MKKEVVFECEVDGNPETVYVSTLHGGGSLQIMINNFFIMNVDFRGDRWVMLCNNISWLTSDELTIILEEFGWEE